MERKLSFGKRLSRLFRKASSRDHLQQSLEIQERLQALQSEHVRLAQALEQTFRQYDEKSRLLAHEIVDGVERGVTQSDLDRLERLQNELWRLVRRSQAAKRTTSQLEQELIEWRSQPTSSYPDAHPEHPSIRAEIVASELRVRGIDPSPIQSAATYEGSVRDVDPFADLLCDSMRTNTDSVASSQDAEVLSPEALQFDIDERSAILDEIHACARELKRMLAHEDREHLRSEIVTQYSDLRRFHGALRRIDRRFGTRRERISIGSPLFH